MSVLSEIKAGISYSFSNKIIGRVLTVYGFFILLSVPAGFMAALLVSRVYGETYWYLTAVELVGFAGMTLGGVLMGCSRAAASEFSFFMAIPTMAGASLLKLLKFGLNFTAAEMVILLVGCVSAFVVSIIAIRTFIGYIKKHSFTAFGWYRIALGALVAAYFLVK